MVILKNDYEASQSKLKESKANYYPSISANVLALRRISSLSATFGSVISSIPGLKNSFEMTNYTTSLSLEQNIWDFGKRASFKKLAMVNVELSFLQIKKKEQEIIYNVKKSYYNLLQAKVSKEITLLTLKNMEVLLESIKAREKQGLATYIDILNIEAEYIKVKVEVKKIEHQIELAFISLANFLGKKINEEFILAEEIPFLPEEYSLNFDECFNQALKSRLEFKKLSLQEHFAWLNIAGIQSEQWPTIGVSTEYGLLDNSFPPKEQNWSIGFSISIPIFHGFKTRSKLEVANQELKNIEIRKKLFIQNLKLQIKNNYYKVQEAKENIEVVRKKQEYFNENLKATEAKYNEGIISLPEFIEAQTKKVTAEIENQEILYHYYLTLNEFAYSCGAMK